MRLREVIQYGTRAEQPAATTVDVGVLYGVSDEGVVERSNGTTWDPWGGNTVVVTCKTALFEIAGTATVVAAVPGKRIKVAAVKLITDGDVGVYWRSSVTTPLEGQQVLAPNGGYTESLPPPNFLFATAQGESLDLVISGYGTVAGRVTYWDSDAT